MLKPLTLFLVSILLAMSAFVPGSPLGVEAFYIGILSASAAFLLLVVAAFQDEAPKWRKVAVLDGSNVMHWQDNQPDLNTVKRVAAAARKQGLKPVVYFDANAGYLTRGKYLGPAELSRHIGVPRRDIHIAPKGLPADPLLLKAAKRLNARVISNDKFRDWLDTHPYVQHYGFLIPGDVRDRKVQLALG